MHLRRTESRDSKLIMRVIINTGKSVTINCLFQQVLCTELTVRNLCSYPQPARHRRRQSKGSSGVLSGTAQSLRNGSREMLSKLCIK